MTIPASAPVDRDALDVEFSLRGGYALNGEEFSPAKHILDLSGRLFHRDEFDTETELGSIQGGFLNIGRLMNESIDIADAMDAKSTEEHECYCAFFADQAWRSDLLDVIEEYPFGFLIVNRIAIEQPYRGKELGLRLLERLLASTFIPNTTIVALKPHALGHQDDPAAFAAGTAKLRAYWSRAGLRPVPDNGFGYYYTYIH
jgi:hypothetical protein